MDFEYTAEEQSFREEVRGFLKQNLPPKNQQDGKFLNTWLEKVREKGWVGFSWPKEYGGSDGGLIEQAILREEMALAKAPPLGTSFMGLAWVGPGIMQYGTDEQKQKFIPDILDSKVSWCTGYSEPNYGSDLASIQCKAVKEGDHYVVNGQKIWTSGAPWADWIILLVRTSWDPEKKHRGITCLLVPMDAEGVEVRPIENMAGRPPLRRGVLHRREGAGGEPARRGRPGLDGHRVGAGQRALEHRRGDPDVRQARHPARAGEEDHQTGPSGQRGPAGAPHPGDLRGQDRGHEVQRPCATSPSSSRASRSPPRPR